MKKWKEKKKPTSKPSFSWTGFPDAVTDRSEPVWHGYWEQLLGTAVVSQCSCFTAEQRATGRPLASYLVVETSLQRHLLQEDLHCRLLFLVSSHLGQLSCRSSHLIFFFLVSVSCSVNCLVRHDPWVPCSDLIVSFPFKGKQAFLQRWERVWW